MLKQETLVYAPIPTMPANEAVYYNKVGQTYFEINNYLGNVNAVITDRKSANLTPSASNASTWEAVVMNTSDYYPFGMTMPGRSTSYGTGTSYRYAYNAMELDNEVSGNGNSYTTEFRQYDSRLGRWKSLDPLMAKFPWMSPYVAFDNNPVFFTDPLGLESEGGGGPEGEPEKKTDDKRAGGDAGNGEFNGHQEVGEVSVSASRSPGKIESIEPPTKDNSKKYSVEIKINDKTIDTKFFERRYDALIYVIDFNVGQDKIFARRARLRQSEMAALSDRVEKGKHLEYAKNMALLVAAPVVLPWVIEGGAAAYAFGSDAALWNFMSAQTAVTNTVTALSKFAAGRVVIWTTSIILGTTLPTVGGRKGSPTTTVRGDYFNNMGRYPAGTGFGQGGRITNVGGQVTAGPFGQTSYFQTQVGTASMVGANPLNDLNPLHPLFSHPIVRPTSIIGGSYLIYKYQTHELYQEANKNNGKY